MLAKGLCSTGTASPLNPLVLALILMILRGILTNHAGNLAGKKPILFHPGEVGLVRWLSQFRSWKALTLDLFLGERELGKWIGSPLPREE